MYRYLDFHLNTGFSKSIFNNYCMYDGYATSGHMGCVQAKSSLSLCSHHRCQSFSFLTERRISITSLYTSSSVSPNAIITTSTRHQSCREIVVSQVSGKVCVIYNMGLQSVSYLRENIAFVLFWWHGHRYGHCGPEHDKQKIEQQENPCTKSKVKQF